MRQTPVVPSPYEQLNEPEWLRTEYLERGRTAADIAAEVGCPPKTLHRALARHGIRREHRTMTAVPASWLREQHVQRGRSIVSIAQELGLSPTSVRRAMAEASIPVDDRRLPPELDDPTWLAAHLEMPRAEVARMLGVTKEAVSRARMRHGFREPRAARYWQLGDRAWLERRYVGDGRTQQEIAEEVGCSRAAVTNALHRNGIPTRPTRSPQYPQLRDRAWLRARVEAGRSAVQIARELGCHDTTASAALRAQGLV